VVSERTAELVDAEIKRILEESYRRAHAILEANLETLHRMATALLERETLDREDVELLAAGKELPARPPTPELPRTPRPALEKPRVPDAGPVLGTPPAEPAGA
jgi:cell division protease FtsH